MSIKRTLSLAAVAAVTVSSLAACGRTGAPVVAGLNAGGVNAAAAARRASERGGTWNILVHMSAENNLYRFGLEDLNEMEAGLPENGDVRVFVLFDGIKAGDSAVYRVKRDSGMNTTIISEKVAAPEVIPASNEIDSGSIETGVKFVQFIAKNFPADHTMAAYWDHGSGLFNGNTNPITKGFGYDDNGTHMTTADLTKLTVGHAAVAGKPMDIVGFDACLMAHGELAFQTKGSANYLLASEELEPGAGWDYRGWFNALAATSKSRLTPSNVGSALVTTYIKSYSAGGSQQPGADATLSMVDNNAFNGAFVTALNAFSAAAIADPAAKAMLQGARAKTQTFYNKDCADIGNFLANVKAAAGRSAVGDAAGKALDAYKTSIVAEGHSAKFTGATGAVLYFPGNGQAIKPVYNDASQIAFAATSWKDFLKATR